MTQPNKSRNAGQSAIDLVEATKSIAELRKSLSDGGFDGPVVVTLSVERLCNILRRYADGQLSREYVEDWADLVEVREDIAFDPSCSALIKQAIHELANPELYGSKTPEDARRIADKLDYGEGGKLRSGNYGDSNGKLR